ncbi:helix-turn-helix domain-containing protein [Brevundimonas sp. BAL450]|uniref:GlxA family transcriptional regulator n=1 Tax=Brevundimonas sp. BAL450 TaxID=1708162 RepID=UPI0018CB92BA|nr:helix-turn-helix domain-containing protein [Brevundimonas sp. BAL450]MBG7614720.1 helix-turn-helix domain-containing protein [Brevundimonas sp. BAL450]
MPSTTTSAMPHQVVILAYPGAHLLNIAGSAEVFAAANRAMQERSSDAASSDNAPYRLTMVSRDGGGVLTAAGVEIATRPLSDLPPTVNVLIIPGGAGIRPVMADEAMTRWIADTARRSRRVIGLGGGSFILAGAGLLSGRRCVSHWRFEDDFEREHPAVHLVRDALFVVDGPFITAAGSSASLDVGLRLVEEDVGPLTALHVAAMLVTPRIRAGDQPQLSAEMKARLGAAPRIARAIDWMSENVARRISVGDAAERFAMSERNFSRAFRKETGLSPSAFMERLRLEAAQRWLNGSPLALEEVAQRCGYSGAVQMARAFQVHFGMTPLAYRRASAVSPRSG